MVRSRLRGMSLLYHYLSTRIKGISCHKTSRKADSPFDCCHSNLAVSGCKAATDIVHKRLLI